MAAQQLSELPDLPGVEEKVLRQAEVNIDLWNLVEVEMKKQGKKIRNVVEYGMEAFLLKSNPAAYAKWETIKRKLR